MALRSTLDLLEAIREVENEAAYHNVNILCCDGSVMTSGLLLASVSPLIKTIGSNLDGLGDIMHVMLPDFTVKEMVSFLDQLVSPVAPEDPDVAKEMQIILKFFGQNPDLNQAPIWSKNETSKDDCEPRLENILVQAVRSKVTTGELFNSDKTDHEDQLWKDSADSEDCSTDESKDPSKIFPQERPKRPHRSLKRMVKTESLIKAKAKAEDDYDTKDNITAMIRQCYDELKAVYICNYCGTERKTARTLQQHLAWHKKYPNEDFHTSNLCKACGKVCTDHSHLRAHMRLVHSPRTVSCTYEGCDKTFKVHLNKRLFLKDFF